jgi:hypothetical protein
MDSGERCHSKKQASLLYSKSKSKSKLYYDRQSVGQSVLVSGTHLGPATNLSHSLIIFLRQFRVC